MGKEIFNDGKYKAEIVCGWSDLEPITNYQRLKNMSIKEMRKFLEVYDKCIFCSQNDELAEELLFGGQDCDHQCDKHIQEWLEAKCDE